MAHSTFGQPRFVKPALALILLALALALNACGHGAAGPAPIQPAPLPGGGSLIRIEQSGVSRVAVERPAGVSIPWEVLSLRNAGVTPLRNVDFWSQGRTSLLLPPGGNFKPEDLYTPFTLLPGEDFALSAPTGTEQLFGILQWLSPRDPKSLRGSFQNMKNAKIRPDGTIALTPGKSEAWLQFDLTAPLTYSSVRVAWEAEPEPISPQLWINLEGDVWARIPQPRPRVDWLHPADITQTVAGNRHFWLRLVYEIPEEGQTEAGAALAAETLVLRRIRIDREVQGPGHLRAWRPGTNLFDLSLQGRSKPELEIRIKGK
jgi:hypothetical protein